MDYQRIKKKIIDFKDKDDQLKIVIRKAPLKSEFFFKKLYKSLNSTYGFVSYSNSVKDIKKILKLELLNEIMSDPFYDIWINDMSNLCKIFCKFIGEDKISFWIGTKRGCKRYHVDMVPFRLLVTYAGQGTELLPDYAANREAFVQGKPNNKIVKDKSALKFINKWDIGIFRGGKEGILHRTPDSALNANSSILMRLDNSSFLEEIKKINFVA